MRSQVAIGERPREERLHVLASGQFPNGGPVERGAREVPLQIGAARCRADAAQEQSFR
jgi:hypothetical protein